MLPWESATTISPAPAARAAAIAAFASSVISSRKRAYSKPCGESCSPVTTPAMPSMSTEMKMRGPEAGAWATDGATDSTNRTMARRRLSWSRAEYMFGDNRVVFESKHRLEENILDLMAAILDLGDGRYACLVEQRAGSSSKSRSRRTDRWRRCAA